MTNSDLIVKFIKELYRLKATYKFRCIINSTLLEYNLATFINENQLMNTLKEHHVDVIDITSHPIELRLHTKDIKDVNIEDNKITLEMTDNRTIIIDLDNK